MTEYIYSSDSRNNLVHTWSGIEENRTLCGQLLLQDELQKLDKIPTQREWDSMRRHIPRRTCSTCQKMMKIYGLEGARDKAKKNAAFRKLFRKKWELQTKTGSFIEIYPDGYVRTFLRRKNILTVEELISLDLVDVFIKERNIGYRTILKLKKLIEEFKDTK